MSSRALEVVDSGSVGSSESHDDGRENQRGERTRRQKLLARIQSLQQLRITVGQLWTDRHRHRNDNNNDDEEAVFDSSVPDYTTGGPPIPFKFILQDGRTDSNIKYISRSTPIQQLELRDDGVFYLREESVRSAFKKMNMYFHNTKRVMPKAGMKPIYNPKDGFYYREAVDAGFLKAERERVYLEYKNNGNGWISKLSTKITHDDAKSHIITNEQQVTPEQLQQLKDWWCRYSHVDKGGRVTPVQVGRISSDGVLIHEGIYPSPTEAAEEIFNGQDGMETARRSFRSQCVEYNQKPTHLVRNKFVRKLYKPEVLAKLLEPTRTASAITWGGIKQGPLFLTGAYRGNKGYPVQQISTTDDGGYEIVGEWTSTNDYVYAKYGKEYTTIGNSAKWRISNNMIPFGIDPSSDHGKLAIEEKVGEEPYKSYFFRLALDPNSMYRPPEMESEDDYQPVRDGFLKLIKSQLANPNGEQDPAKFQNPDGKLWWKKSRIPMCLHRGLWRYVFELEMRDEDDWPEGITRHGKKRTTGRSTFMFHYYDHEDNYVTVECYRVPYLGFPGLSDFHVGHFYHHANSFSGTGLMYPNDNNLQTNCNGPVLNDDGSLIRVCGCGAEYALLGETPYGDLSRALPCKRPGHYNYSRNRIVTMEDLDLDKYKELASALRKKWLDPVNGTDITPIHYKPPAIPNSLPVANRTFLLEGYEYDDPEVESETRSDGN